MRENEISRAILDAAIEVHRTLGGPGLLESVYEEALAHELRLRGHKVARQQSVPITYKGRKLGAPLRVDLLVDRLVVVECKSVWPYNRIFESQALTYLRLLSLRVALVINFGEHLVKDGVHRVINSP